MVGPQGGHRGEGRAHDAPVHDVHRLGEVLGAHGLDGPDLDHTRVGDEDVQASEPPRRGRHEPRGHLRIADVACDLVDLDPAGPQVGGRGGEAVRRAGVDDQVVAAIGQFARQQEPQTTTGARHDGNRGRGALGTRFRARCRHIGRVPARAPVELVGRGMVMSVCFGHPANAAEAVRRTSPTGRGHGRKHIGDRRTGRAA